MDANERESRAAKLSREHSRHAVENLGQFRVAFFHPRLFAFIRIHSRGTFLIRKEVSPVYSHAFTVSHFDGANNIRFFGTTLTNSLLNLGSSNTSYRTIGEERVIHVTKKNNQRRWKL
jgi:hypothetical protein